MMLVRLLSTIVGWLAGFMREMDRGMSMRHSREALLERTAYPACGQNAGERGTGERESEADADKDLPRRHGQAPRLSAACNGGRSARRRR